jgi:hypothetical protein
MRVVGTSKGREPSLASVACFPRAWERRANQAARRTVVRGDFSPCGSPKNEGADKSGTAVKETPMELRLFIVSSYLPPLRYLAVPRSRTRPYTGGFLASSPLFSGAGDLQ